MSYARKIAKVLLRTLATAVALGLGLLLALWLRPDWLVNERNLERVAGFLAKKGISLQWASMQLEIHAPRFRDKQIDWRLKDFCYREGKETELCFSQIDLSAGVRWRGLFSFSAAVNHFRLDGGRWKYVAQYGPAEAKSTEANNGPLLPRLPSFLHALSFGQIAIRLDEVRLFLADGVVYSDLNLQADGQTDRSQWDVSAAGSYRTGDELYRLQLGGQLASQKSQWFGPYHLNSQVSARLPNGKGVELKFALVPDGGEKLKFEVTGNSQWGKTDLRLTAQGAVDQGNWKAKLAGRIRGLHPQLPLVSWDACELSWLRENPDAKESNVHVDCPTRWGSKAQVLAMLLAADAQVTDRAAKPRLRGKLTFRSPDDAVSLSTEMNGELAKFPEQWNFKSHAHARVNDFQNLVKVSRPHSWAIPAPFNNLGGTAEIKIDGAGRIADGITLPVVLETRLASKQQKLNIDGNGELKITAPRHSPEFDFDFTALLSDVVLFLPDLKRAKPPQFFPDRRLQANLDLRAPAATPETSFRYRVAIRTPGDHPLRLVSNLAKEEIPIALDLQATESTAPNGTLRIAAFPVDMIRRKASVDHFTLGFTGNPETTTVDGEVRVVYTDYTIKILLLGRLAEPVIKFQSEPALPEDQVLAVLLFGRKMEALDSDQSGSLGSTKAAIADGAISLASMYLLASTPVESVSYDPLTHLFKAKIRLADGTSLAIGTERTQLNEIGVRKRLGRDWAIATYLENPLSPLGQSLTAFLEWSRRY